MQKGVRFLLPSMLAALLAGCGTAPAEPPEKVTLEEAGARMVMRYDLLPAAVE